MKIVKDLLEKNGANEKIVRSLSSNAREVIDPDYLVIHYTAGDTAQEAVNWFLNTQNNPDHIAAHIVLDLDGTITQLVPFNRRANHAGSSVWDGVENFNFHSIGIEIVNPGFCERLSDKSFQRKVTATRNQTYPKTRSKDIQEADHKHRFWSAANNKYWFRFSDAQLNSLYNVSRLLMGHYQLVTALGHDDISPLRKSDPGPCFPWKDFKMNVFGQANNVGDIFLVNQDGTNFRVDHSTTSAVIKKLPKNYNVGLIETFGSWSKVYLANERKELLKDNRCIKTIGWIHSSLLELK